MTFSSTPAVVGSIAPAESAMVVREVAGSHVITIDGYSRTKELRSPESFSHNFMAAGHHWCLKYYPKGDGWCSTTWISMHLQLDEGYKCVKARVAISLLDWDGRPVPSCNHVSERPHTLTMGYNSRDISKFIKRKALEKSAYLFKDCFKVRCDIAVITEDSVAPAARPVVVVPPPDNITVSKKEEDAAPERFVVVPPPNMHRHLAHLLSSGEGADVTLEADGEMFRAHSSILAARSPVFKAELLRRTEEGTSTSCMTIKDIEARVLNALLHFVYTDSLPDIDEGEAMVMAQHLLIAADRYSLERLKLICEDMLCSYIGTSSVGTILALAEQHRCDGLKKACLKFHMSGSNLKAAIATDGSDHLANIWPSVLKKLLSKVVQ
ncbi:unnamed protein product [Urochloa decumbens]|uniref:Uncharacterized protein n=1 Tax=Urochloa decumbens TaxID=240449 RepID=A0ABC9B486_9POAL